MRRVKNRIIDDVYLFYVSLRISSRAHSFFVSMDKTIISGRSSELVGWKMSEWDRQWGDFCLHILSPYILLLNPTTVHYERYEIKLLYQ